MQDENFWKEVCMLHGWGHPLVGQGLLYENIRWRQLAILLAEHSRACETDDCTMNQRKYVFFP